MIPLACSASVYVDRHSIIITVVGRRESRVLSKWLVAFIILHISANHHVGRCSQTVKIIVP